MNRFPGGGGAPAVTDWFPDASDYGQVVRPLSPPDLVAVPFRAGQYQSNAYGAASITQAFGRAVDNDGDGSALDVQVPAAIANAALLKWLFNGSALGLRYALSDSSSSQDFSLMVDGVVRRVPGQFPAMAPLLVSETDGWTNVLLFTDLDPTVPHYAEILVPAGPANTNSLLLLSYLADRKAGYVPASRQVVLGTPADVPTAAAAISLGASPAAGLGLLGCRYNNKSATSQTVLVTIGGVIVDTLVLAAAGSAGCSQTWSLGALGNSSTAVMHSCATAAAVTATPVYGF